MQVAQAGLSPGVSRKQVQESGGRGEGEEEIGPSIPPPAPLWSSQKPLLISFSASVPLSLLLCLRSFSLPASISVSLSLNLQTSASLSPSPRSALLDLAPTPDSFRSLPPTSRQPPSLHFPPLVPPSWLAPHKHQAVPERHQVWVLAGSDLHPSAPQCPAQDWASILRPLLLCPA